MDFPQDLCIGDILLYNTDSIVDDLIDLKTWSDVAHVEIYVGDGWSVASRNGLGVDLYPYRPDSLHKVRRLSVPFDKENADTWFNSGVKGQKYNWASLAEFFNIHIQSQGFICSVFAANYLRYGGCELFAPDYEISKISPRDFELTLQAVTVYHGV
jgi:hypothetical protein